MSDLFSELGISEVYPYTTWQIHFPTAATFKVYRKASVPVSRGSREGAALRSSPRGRRAPWGLPRACSLTQARPPAGS